MDIDMLAIASSRQCNELAAKTSPPKSTNNLNSATAGGSGFVNASETSSQQTDPADCTTPTNSEIGHKFQPETPTDVQDVDFWIFCSSFFLFIPFIWVTGKGRGMNVCLWTTGGRKSCVALLFVTKEKVEHLIWKEFLEVRNIYSKMMPELLNGWDEKFGSRKDSQEFIINTINIIIAFTI